MFENRFLNFVNQIIYIRNQAGRYALNRRFDVVAVRRLYFSAHWANSWEIFAWRDRGKKRQEVIFIDWKV